MRWDLFCRVVDNLGDIGVCWRLTRQLTVEFQILVRLWVDDLTSFSRFRSDVDPEQRSQTIEGVEVRRWDPVLEDAAFDDADVGVADVVIEAFACELPVRYIEAMERKSPAPVWINLEYLSAESWVEDCHLMTSPQFRSSLQKVFFFPGFTERTGGLLRDAGLLERRADFLAGYGAANQSDGVLMGEVGAQADFWRRVNVPPRLHSQVGTELWVCLFCYENPALVELLDYWASGSQRVRVLVTPGWATRQVAAWCGSDLQPGDIIERGNLIAHAVPYVSQDDFDRLLWVCDVNFVRGEDSFVRAQWAQRPFVWQIYPQDDNAHQGKLQAFLERYLAGLASGFHGEPSHKFPPELHGDQVVAESVRRCWQAWNGTGTMVDEWPEFVAHRFQLQQHSRDWIFQLDRAGNLANNLTHFVRGKWGRCSDASARL